jgi:hypothetical protein
MTVMAFFDAGQLVVTGDGDPNEITTSHVDGNIRIFVNGAPITIQTVDGVPPTVANTNLITVDGQGGDRQHHACRRAARRPPVRGRWR